MNTNALRSKYALAFAVLLLLVCCVRAQNSRSSITGFVFDIERRAITQIPVELLNEVNTVLSRTRTDGSGRYSFVGLSSGRFSIRVLPGGTDLEGQTQDVEIAGIGVTGRPIADHIQKDFYLRPRKDDGREKRNEVVFAQEVPQEARDLYEKAVSDLERNKTDKATESLKAAVRIFPRYYLARERLGLIELNEQRYAEAEKHFVAAVEVNQRSYVSWYGLALAQYALSHSPDAAASAARAATIDSNSVEALLLLGISLRQNKQYEEAEVPLKRASDLSKGKFPDVHWNLALLYAHNLQRFSDAANELELYLKASPDIPNKGDIKKLIKKFRGNSPSSD